MNEDTMMRGGKILDLSQANVPTSTVKEITEEHLILLANVRNNSASGSDSGSRPNSRRQVVVNFLSPGRPLSASVTNLPRSSPKNSVPKHENRKKLRGRTLITADTVTRGVRGSSAGSPTSNASTPSKQQGGSTPSKRASPLGSSTGTPTQTPRSKLNSIKVETKTKIEAEAVSRKGRGVVSPTPRRGLRNGRNRKGRKAIQSLIAREGKERAEIEDQYVAGHRQLLQYIALFSFEPQRRAILHVQEVLRNVMKEYGDRAKRAEDALAKLTQGTVHLVESVHKSGLLFLKDGTLLNDEVPFNNPDITVDATVLECARDPSSYLQEIHVPLKRPDSQEGPEVEKIRSFFLNGNHVSDEKTTLPLMDAEILMDKVDQLNCQIIDLASASTSLLQRAQRRIEQWKKKNEVLQNALDEMTTRVKVADGILQETVMKRKEEVDSAIQVCGQFGVELRARMDAIEKYVKETLSELIDRSTEVSIENNAYHENAQLIHNKENALQLFMSKMETAVVEQGKLLRDVRLETLKLWKTRCRNGDEERATLKHSGLPKKHRVALDACDRETLLRLLHFVSLNSDDAPALLIGALDEHDYFMKGHTAEAEAVARRASTEAAVTALLEKLYEEGEIKPNPNCLRASLVETIYDMVLHYNTYMVAQEKQHRRALRKEARKEVSSPLPFFDKRAPVPPEYAVDIATSPLLQMKQPVLSEDTADHKRLGTATHTTHKSDIVLPVINAQSRNNESDTALPRIENGQILRYLRRSHPSELDPPGTASVVGFGRWGGEMAQRRVDDGTKPTLNTVVSHIADTDNGVLCSVHSTRNPPPGVPPRLSIVRHMLEDHCNDLEALASLPNLRRNCFHGEDEPFLKLQRELFETTF